MRSRTAAMIIVLASVAPAWGQARRPARPAARAAAQPNLTKAAAVLTCPAALGTGTRSKRAFCDVLTGTNPAQGIVVTIPPHTGPTTLMFDLHNRQTYSEEQTRAGRAYARYTATIGVLSMDNTWLERAAIQSEFRTEKDLFDRIEGGAGTRSIKAVAPTGTESIYVRVPANINQVSVLGERLQVERLDGQETYTSPGRPIAVISNVMIEYRPAPARRR